MVDKEGIVFHMESDMYASVATRSANAYKRVAVDTTLDVASPHALVSMLFDELLRSLACARTAIVQKDVNAKVRHIGKAIRILEEGLRAPLNLDAGGELGANLYALYEYCSHKLVLANARSDEKGLQEITDLITPIAQSWKQIGGRVNDPSAT
jgi:flagellar protein FliS